METEHNRAGRPQKFPVLDIGDDMYIRGHSPSVVRRECPSCGKEQIYGKRKRTWSCRTCGTLSGGVYPPERVV